LQVQVQDQSSYSPQWVTVLEERRGLKQGGYIGFSHYIERNFNPNKVYDTVKM
jgi:hypothetical protein